MCKIHFVSKSCVLLHWQRYCTALQQRVSAKLQRVQGMELWNFRRGCQLYSVGRPSRWASAHILVVIDKSSSSWPIWKLGVCAAFRGSWVPHLTQYRLGHGLLCSKRYPHATSHLATIDTGRKLGGLCPFGGSWVSIKHKVALAEAYTSIPSGILIHPAVWPQKKHALKTGGWPSVDIHEKFYGDRSRGTPPPSIGVGLNAIGAAKYSDFGPIEGYISEMVQDRRLVGWLAFNVPFQHKYGYIRDERQEVGWY